MNIDEAIEVFERELEDTFIGSEEKWKRALKLGLEALKRVKWQRIPGGSIRENLLPGETKG